METLRNIYFVTNELKQAALTQSETNSVPLTINDKNPLKQS